MCGFVSTTREMLARFVETHVPVAHEQNANSSAALSVMRKSSTVTASLQAAACVLQGSIVSVCRAGPDTQLAAQAG